MAERKPKRPRGRPPKEGDDIPLRLRLPKHHYDYLRFLVVNKSRLGTSVNEAAEYILIRELDNMFTSGYHEKDIPEE